MPADHFIKVLKEIRHRMDPKQLTVVITGGEPTLRKDLETTGMAIRKLGFRWSMVTNGQNLSDQRLNGLLNAGMGSITVSHDGLREEHDWLRRHPGSFEQTINALHAIAAHPRLTSDVVTCVHRRNLRHLHDIQQEISRTGILNWRLFTITPIGRAALYPELQLNRDELKQLLDFISNERKNGSLPRPAFSCESFTGTFEGDVRDGYFFCRAGIHIGSILANGDIGACPNIDRKLVQGNIYTDSFTEVWETRFSPYRNRQWTKSDQCLDCTDYRYCEGSGLHWWHEGHRRGGCYLGQS